MARGWESKSVESQMDAAESRRDAPIRASLTPEQQRILRERESLELSRKRVLTDLESTEHPRRREQLRSALQFLDERLAALQ